MYLMITFLWIFSIFISPGYLQELSLPQISGERRHNQYNNQWPLQTIHTVKGNFYGKALRNVHAKPCPRRRNFQNSEEMQGVPTFSSRVTKPLVINDNNNLKSQSLMEVDAKLDADIGNEISQINQKLSSKQLSNNNDDLNEFKTSNNLSSNNDSLPSVPTLDILGLDTNKEAYVPEISIVNDNVSQNNLDHERPVGNDEVLGSVEPSDEYEDDKKNSDDSDLSSEDNNVPKSSENEPSFRNIEYDDIRKLEPVISNIETEEPEILLSSGIVPEVDEHIPNTKVNAEILPNNCLQKSGTKDSLSEPSRRFLSRPEQQIVLNSKKLNEGSLMADIKSQSVNDNKANKLYNSGAIAKVDKNYIRNKVKDELNADNASVENEYTLRTQTNKQTFANELEPTKGQGISNMEESRVMLMKNTRVCFACSTIDNPTCWAPTRRTTVKYCRKEHDACVTKTFVGASSLIMVRDCGNTCNDPGITGLVPKYKSCSICHSDLCNSAYSVNSHNLMIILFLISLAKFAL